MNSENQWIVKTFAKQARSDWLLVCRVKAQEGPNFNPTAFQSDNSSLPSPDPLPEAMGFPEMLPLNFSSFART